MRSSIIALLYSGRESKLLCGRRWTSAYIHRSQLGNAGVYPAYTQDSLPKRFLKGVVAASGFEPPT